MYFPWLKSISQRLGHSSNLQDQPQVHNTVKPGVNPQQSAIFCNGGPSNSLAENSHQTAGAKYVGYQRPFVTLQNTSCSIQRGQPYHENGQQNAVPVTLLHSSVQHGSEILLRPSCYQGRNSQFSSHRNHSPPTLDSNTSSSALQYRMSNEGSQQVFNQGSSKPTSTAATPLQFRMELMKTVQQPSNANNMHIVSANKAQHGPLPSAHTGNVFCDLSTFAAIPISTGQNLQISSLNQPTKQFSYPVLNSSQINTPLAAETRNNVPVTLLQVSTCQQITTKQSKQLATAKSNDIYYRKTHPLLSHLLLSQGLVSDSAQSISSHKTNDNSSFAKVVAVVQPLSPQCNTDTSAINCPATQNLNVPTVGMQNNTTTFDGRNPCESETQPQFNKCHNIPTPAARLSDNISKGLSVRPSATKNTFDMLSKDHCIGAFASQAATLQTPERDKGANNNDEMPLEAQASILKLSSLPTIKWSIKELALMCKPIATEGAPKDSLQKELIDMFWGGNIENLVCMSKTKAFAAFVKYVPSFCNKYVGEDTVVLSQVDPLFVDQLKQFHVMKNGEVYTEQPYTSSWLNNNQQLDDIDKEFGPNVYRYVLDNEPDPVKKVAKMSPPTYNKVTTPDSETVDTGCHDSLYCFEIQILSPEKAKVIFEQGHVGTSLSTESTSLPEEVANACDAVVDEPIQDLHITSGLQIANPINYFCCIAKWKENIFGSKTPLHGKCKCKEELSDFTKKRDQINCQQFEMEPNLQSHPVEGNIESKSKAKITNSLPTISWLEICNKISGTFELNDDDKTIDLHEQQPKGSQANTIRMYKEEFANHVADNEEDFNEAHLKPAEICLATESHTTDDSWKENQIVNLMSPTNEYSEQAPMASSHMTKPPLETKHQIQCSTKSASQTNATKTGTHETDVRKRRRLSNANSIFPYLKKLMNKNLDSYQVDVSQKKVVGSDSEPLVSERKTVQLKLFGSLPQEKHASNDHCNETTKPPNVIFATVDSKLGPATKSLSSQKRLGTNIKLITGREKKFHSSDGKDHVDNDKRKKGNAIQTVLPIQENVLKFNVLPTSFSFENGSPCPEETTEESSDEPSESKMTNPNKKSRVDVWSTVSMKESSSVHHCPVSRSSGVFAEYQKKYILKSQSSIIQ